MRLFNHIFFGSNVRLDFSSSIPTSLFPLPCVCSCLSTFPFSLFHAHTTWPSSTLSFYVLTLSNPYFPSLFIHSYVMSQRFPHSLPRPSPLSPFYPRSPFFSLVLGGGRSKACVPVVYRSCASLHPGMGNTDLIIDILRLPARGSPLSHLSYLLLSSFTD